MSKDLPQADARLEVVRALRPTLLVTLHTELDQDETAVSHYDVDVDVVWSPDEGPEVNGDVLSALAGVDVHTYLPEVDAFLPDVLRIPVGGGDVIRADLAAPSCYDELADLGPDVQVVANALLGEDDDLRELHAAFPLVHKRALILNYIEVEPEWRGAGYGLLAAGLVLRELSAGVDVAALFPMPRGVTDLEVRAAAAQGLGEYWGRLGFVAFNGIRARAM
jgi:GNAT superfamily N-acetyltransferase